MRIVNIAAIMLLLAAAGCGGGGGGGGGGSTPSASNAFVAGVQAIVSTSPEDDEPADVSNTAEASDDDAEPLAI